MDSFFVRTRFVFLGLFFFRPHVRTISWAEPGWEDGLDKERLTAQMDALQIIEKSIRFIDETHMGIPRSQSLTKPVVY